MSDCDCGCADITPSDVQRFVAHHDKVVADLIAKLDAIGQAWDDFDAKVIRPVEGGFRIVDSAEAWQAYHKVDGLVADWQLRADSTENPPSLREGE